MDNARKLKRNNKRKLIPYGRQSIERDDIEAVIKTLKTNWLTQGPKVIEFEEELAKYCGTKYAVAFANGTAALHGAYYAAGLQKDDEFITTPNTFVATVNAGVFLGAIPRFADIELNTGNIDVKLIEKQITKKTKLIVPVDYAGQPCDLDEIIKLAKKNDITIIEDACHALGAKYKNKKIGSVADMTVFSFHPVKSITTGEGGSVVTNNKEFYEKLKKFRTHGITKSDQWTYEMTEPGLNYRLSDIHASLGVSQLKKIDKFIKKRSKIAKQYNQELKGIVGIPKMRSGRTSSWHLYPILLPKKLAKNKEEILNELLENNIGSQVHYMPAYWYDFYKKNYQKGLCPNAEEFYSREISIPIYPNLAWSDQAHVVSTLKKILNNKLK